MHARALRRRCEAKLAEIDVPEPFDAATFCERIAQRRRRPIRILPLPLALGPDSPCGLWIALDDEDLIFVEGGTSPLHREHILVHELAHMICGHVDGGGVDAVAALLVDLHPEMVRAVLPRASYSTEQEQEAELLASLILAEARGARRRGRPRGAHSPEVDVVLDRASEVFGG